MEDLACSPPAYLHERGFDNAVIFQDTRLQWEQLLGDHRYLSLEQMSRLIRRAIDLTGQPWIGLETHVGRSRAACNSTTVERTAKENCSSRRKWNKGLRSERLGPKLPIKAPSPRSKM